MSSNGGGGGRKRSSHNSSLNNAASSSSTGNMVNTSIASSPASNSTGNAAPAAAETAIPFPAWFPRSAQRLIQANSDSRRAQVLQRLRPALTCPLFIYPDASSTRVGMRSLLLVLSHLLSHLPDYGIDLIPAILYRKEFDYLVPVELADLYSDYRVQLILTARVVFSVLASEKDNQSMTSVSEEKYHLKNNTSHEDVFAKAYNQNQATSTASGSYSPKTDRISKNYLADSLASKNSLFAVCVSLVPLLYIKLPFICGPFLEVLCPTTLSGANSICEEEKDEKFIWKRKLIEEIDQVVLNHAMVEFSTDPFLLRNKALFQWSRFSNDIDDSEIINLVQENAVSLKETFSDPEVYFPVVKGILNFIARNSSGEIFWGAVHGYWTLFRFIVSQVMNVDPVAYSFTMRTCCMEFCRNPELVTFFSKCCLYRTCALDRLAVGACLDILDDYFDMCSSEGRLDTPLPKEFCFDTFLNAINMLLCSDDFQVLCKTLAFLYTNLGRFYGEHREKLLLNVLIKDNFFKLWAHWSFLVRKYYHHILIYKVRRRGFLYDMSEVISSIPRTGSNSSLKEEKAAEKATKIDYSLTGQAFSLVSGLVTAPVSSVASGVSSLVSMVVPSSIFSLFSGAKDESSPYFVSSSDAAKDPYPTREETTAERTHRETLESIDAENCSVISSRLTLIEVQEDEIIENTIMKYIRTVEEDLASNVKTPVQNIPPHLRPYCKLAINEFKLYRQHAIMLQRKYSTTLSCFDVVAPDMFFDIVEFGTSESSIPKIIN